ncbi:hypothetical protein J4410_02245 [Candidatus Woesearchaeota archaeon]|nr:hypothetical protein [Candidatus Woesearchaeota archaeon]
MAITENARITGAHYTEAKKSACILLDQLGKSLIYHRKAHTTDFVVPAALAIAEREGFSLEDKLIVSIAAAFHDTGFVRQYNANESIGAQFAEDYMRSSMQEYTEEQIRLVKDAIINTDMKEVPKTKYEKVLRDADLAILGHHDFVQWNNDLRRECKLHPESPMHQASLDRSKWAQSQLGFISSHTWFTEGAKTLYEESKQQNILAFKKEYPLTQQYAVFVRSKNCDDSSDIVLLVLRLSERDLSSADFFPKDDAQRSEGGYPQKIWRFDSLEDAKRKAEETADGNFVLEAGVVPIDTGEHRYVAMSQEICMGDPVYAVKVVRTLREIRNYDRKNWKETLEETCKRDEHWKHISI